MERQFRWCPADKNASSLSGRWRFHVEAQPWAEKQGSGFHEGCCGGWCARVCTCMYVFSIWISRSSKEVGENEQSTNPAHAFCSVWGIPWLSVYLIFALIALIKVLALLMCMWMSEVLAELFHCNLVLVKRYLKQLPFSLWLGTINIFFHKQMVTVHCVDCRTIPEF